MIWRLIEQEAHNAAMNMAIDEAICKSVASKERLPAIRLYKWKNNSVSIGSNQNQSEVNLDLCKKSNVDIVRRITGGRAVFHDKRDFTYSVIAPIKTFDNNINKAYAEICSWIINALQDFDIKSTLQNKNDIIVYGKKISGNAAKLFDSKIYLQHGTLIYDVDFELMPEVLNISKGTAKKKIASVLEFKNISQDKAYTALKNNFIKNKEFKIEKLAKEELKRAEELAKTKYNSFEADKGILLRNKGACYVESGN